MRAKVDREDLTIKIQYVDVFKVELVQLWEFGWEEDELAEARIVLFRI